MNFDEINEIDYFTTINSNNNINETNNFNLYNSYEGYVKGNLFQNLYDSYKNLKPINININNERDELLINIGELSFARHELNLLLDNYPNNSKYLDLFNKYRELENNAVNNYERRFGPLNITSNDMENVPFKWESDKWPWEK